MGFEINPYFLCIANQIINGSQCTVVWHVDDLKILHVDACVVTKVTQDLTGILGVKNPSQLLEDTYVTIREFNLTFLRLVMYAFIWRSMRKI